jgi:hypothetical protein
LIEIMRTPDLIKKICKSSIKKKEESQQI